MPEIPFSKYSGCGNDFILVDNCNQLFPANPVLIQNLCKPRTGIGADGVILLEHSPTADFCMKIFNSDGSEAEMCGNGLRCFGKFLRERGHQGDHFTIDVTGNHYPIQVHQDCVTVTMPPPKDVIWSMRVAIGGAELEMDFIDTGVPHVVLFLDDIEAPNLDALGPLIRHHPQFAPNGTNVNIASVDSKGIIHIRTFERGVEKETLACGTGSAAAAVAAAKRFNLPSPIRVKTRSGEHLTFTLSLHEGEIKEFIMNGPAKKIYEGLVAI